LVYRARPSGRVASQPGSRASPRFRARSRPAVHTIQRGRRTPPWPGHGARVQPITVGPARCTHARGRGRPGDVDLPAV